MRKASRWYYFLPGGVYALGPTTETFTTERAARAYIRECWDMSRLPRGTQVWRA